MNRQSFTVHPACKLTPPPMPDGRPREWVPAHYLGHVGKGFVGYKRRRAWRRFYLWAGMILFCLSAAIMGGLIGIGLGMLFGWMQ